jgi:hypothetical protein
VGIRGSGDGSTSAAHLGSAPRADKTYWSRSMVRPPPTQARPQALDAGPSAGIVDATLSAACVIPFRVEGRDGRWTARRA